MHARSSHEGPASRSVFASIVAACAFAAAALMSPSAAWAQVGSAPPPADTPIVMPRVDVIGTIDRLGTIPGSATVIDEEML